MCRSELDIGPGATHSTVECTSTSWRPTRQRYTLHQTQCRYELDTGPGVAHSTVECTSTVLCIAPDPMSTGARLRVWCNARHCRVYLDIVKTDSTAPYIAPDPMSTGARLRVWCNGRHSPVYLDIVKTDFYVVLTVKTGICALCIRLRSPKESPTGSCETKLLEL